MPERVFFEILRGVIVVISVIAICGCANHAVAPIVNKTSPEQQSVTPQRVDDSQKRPALTRPATYKVQRGDTLYSIAWRFGVDFRNLVKWNRLSNPDLIRVGQGLRLSAPQAKSSPAPTTAKTVNTPNKPRPARPLPQAKFTSGPIKWSWPADGTVQPVTSATGTKGIEIIGQRGNPVNAAADGTVVYSGSGLRGYGALIIVKHNEDFLSAYAHNDQLLVAEGAAVNSGQQIAMMGDSDAKRVMLHFEIRRDGKAVEPLKYLPQR